MTMQPDSPKLHECEVCGVLSGDTRFGLAKSRSKGYISVWRCIDHEACRQRRAAAKRAVPALV